MPGFQERWIVGKTVAAVSRRRFYNERLGRQSTELQWIAFTDGSSLLLGGELTEDNTYVSAKYVPAKRGK